MHECNIYVLQFTWVLIWIPTYVILHVCIHVQICILSPSSYAVCLMCYSFWYNFHTILKLPYYSATIYVLLIPAYNVTSDSSMKDLPPNMCYIYSRSEGIYTYKWSCSTFIAICNNNTSRLNAIVVFTLMCEVIRTSC